MNKVSLAAILLVAATALVGAQEPGYQIPANAPKDDTMVMTSPGHDAFQAQIAQLIEKARQTYPSAKQRFLAGLPKGYGFFVTTVIQDTEGHNEQVFIHVTQVSGLVIAGTVANDVELVKAFHKGQSISISESELIDWMIMNPDGSEEGNLIGKFIDSLQGKDAQKK